MRNIGYKNSKELYQKLIQMDLQMRVAQVAFALCASTGGYLPTFKSKKEFDALFQFFNG